MALHELAERSGNGITVRLWWESETDEVTVTYIDDVYAHGDPCTQPQAPGASLLWTQDNTTACIDVSCAYGKARETSKR